MANNTDINTIAAALLHQENPWEQKFSSWAKGPGETEQQKSENAETAVKKALAAFAPLQKIDVTVFAQGSYRARTNIRQDSDVDICVRLNRADGESTFFSEYPAGMTKADFGHKDSVFTYAQFKNLISAALISYFGESGVKRGKKAFDVHANTYRIDADVVPTLEFREYYGEPNQIGGPTFRSGVQFNPDDGGIIRNYPDQTYNNGVAKNDATGRRYKRVVRILKHLRNEMQEKNVAAAKDVSSFLIESMLWNVTNAKFEGDSFYPAVRACLIEIFNSTKTDEACKNWLEVNGIKYLFYSTQPWTREQAHNFILACWSHVEFK